MLRQIASVLEQYTKGRGCHLLLALSGGRDSVALCHVLTQLQKDAGFSLTAAHFNHGIRGRHSDRDQQFVETLCQKWSVPLVTTKENIPALGGNLEETARTCRYRWLRQQKEALGADWIVTAHHGADQAETVLLHLIRGAGLEGLAAMAIAEGDLLRPMLEVTPSEIAFYCRANRLFWRHDASNDDCSYRRNSLRLEVMPKLQTYNPNIIQALCQTSAICRREDDYLKEQTRAAAQRLLSIEPGKVMMDVEGLKTLHSALAVRLLRQGYAQLTAGSTALTYALCCQILELQEGKELWLTHGVYCCRRGGSLLFSLKKPDFPVVAPWGSYPQKVPGETILKEAGFLAKATLVKLPYPLPGEKDNALLLPLDWQEGLYWRSRRPGDLLSPRGMVGHQKVKELLIDKKIPACDRDRLPLLCRGEEIVWLPGIRQGKIPTLTGEKACLIQVVSL